MRWPLHYDRMSIDIMIAFSLHFSRATVDPNKQLIKDVWSAANILVRSFRYFCINHYLAAVVDDRCGCQSDARSIDRHVDDGMTDAVCTTFV